MNINSLFWYFLIKQMKCLKSKQFRTHQITCEMLELMPVWCWATAHVTPVSSLAIVCVRVMQCCIWTDHQVQWRSSSNVAVPPWSQLGSVGLQTLSATAKTQTLLGCPFLFLSDGNGRWVGRWKLNLLTNTELTQHGINWFKNVYQPRTKLVNDENGDVCVFAWYFK
jgi:hypothetical protein